MRVRIYLMCTTLSCVISSCSLAPTYERPSLPIPEHFKETGVWKQSDKSMDKLKPDAWWYAFNDPVLNQLEAQLTRANQNLKVAYANYQQAYASAQIARSYLFPNVQALFNADRQQLSRHVANAPSQYNYNQILTGAYISYEVDAWGAVRNELVSATRTARASASDVAAIHLSLHAELASNYFALRGNDEQQKILDTTVVAYKKALFLTKKRFSGGVSPIADVDEAETQLENAKTMAADMRLKRAQLEHALAVLVGEVPTHFALKPALLPKVFLRIHPNLPSTLLERRPDVIASELRVQAANAEIGVARAAFFPQFNLTGTGGYQSQSFANLISKPSLFWSIGPLSLLTLVQPIAAVTVFDGGKLRSSLNKAKASYYAQVANYRQTSLQAFQEVEDSLIALKQLDLECRTQNAAAKAAKRAWIQEQRRYEGGVDTFLQVVVAENTALQSELAAIQVHTRRQIASIQLIKALGGGWGYMPRHLVKG